jgi:putative ABC transport system permease protein
MRFILADLRRLWLGSLMVVLLVALAVALGVAVTLQERALRLGSARAADKFDLVIGAAGSETQLVLSTVFLQTSPLPLMRGDVLARLARDPRVAWAAPVGFGDIFQGYPIVGTTTSLVRNLSDGLSAGAIFSTEGQAVIGASVALDIGATIKPMHGNAEEGGHTHTELAYTVVGRLKPTGTAWDRAILVPIQAVWHIHGMGDEHDHGHAEADHDEVAGQHEDHDEHAHEAHADAAIVESWGDKTPGLPAVLVKPRTIADAYKIRQEYRKDTTLAVFPAEILTRLYATLGDAKLVLLAVAFGSQALVAAALLLVTVLHVNQRRRQIGALRALGAPRSALFGIVWMELFGLFAAGIAAGIAIGYGAARLIAVRLVAESGIAMPVVFERGDLWLLGILLGVACLLAAVPGLLAYRQSPAAALRLG